LNPFELKITILCNSEEMERKVFVNYYADGEGQARAGERRHNPIWKYFLREENGKSAMCKLCDDTGVQKILEMKDAGTSPLHRHLKFTHKKSIVSKTGTLTSAAGAQIADPNVPLNLLSDAVIIPQKATGKQLTFTVLTTKNMYYCATNHPIPSTIPRNTSAMYGCLIFISSWGI